MGILPVVMYISHKMHPDTISVKNFHDIPHRICSTKRLILSGKYKSVLNKHKKGQPTKAVLRLSKKSLTLEKRADVQTGALPPEPPPKGPDVGPSGLSAPA